MTLSASPPSETPKTPETTNRAFLDQIFTDLEPDEQPAVVYVDGAITKSAHWKSLPPGDDCDVHTDRRNWYFTLSTYLPANGTYRRTKAQFHRSFGVCLDDVGTKAAPLERLDACPPSYIIETSAGNLQAGFLFDTPCSDLARVEALLDALTAAGLCDSGAKGPSSRLSRLPCGINGKYQPWQQVKLIECHPDRRYSIQEIAQRLELDLAASGMSGQASTAPPALDAVDVHQPRAAQNPVIAELIQRGLYKRPLGEGKHDITCPWVDEHTDGLDNGTVYFEPSGTYPVGGFRCHHSHGDEKGVQALLQHLGISRPQAKHKDLIRVDPGELHRVVDAAERVLSDSGCYYQRGGLIVQVITDPGTQETRIKPVTANGLTRALSACANWEKFDGRTNRIVPCDPPARHTNVLHDGDTYNHLPVLRGITRQPYLRADGSLMATAGYDDGSAMFGAFDAREFRIPESPTKADAERALAKLQSLLREFSFADDVAKSAALAAILTAAVRPSLPTAPMIHIKAPLIGSGKSYLQSIVSAFAGAGTAAVYSFPTSDDECSKLLLSAFLEGPAVIAFDNLTGDLIPFKSLCSALTSEQLTGRILGVSKVSTVSTRTLLLSSGNNVGPIGDMTRRTLTINLDPQCETPATRQFRYDPLSGVLARRGEFVSYALTIVRAYLQAGAPSVSTPQGQALRPLGSFSDWTRLVRAPLVWLGLPDPADALFERMAEDPHRELLGRFLHAWRAVFGTGEVLVRHIVSKAEESKFYPELAEVVHEIADERGGINRRRLGHWVSRHQDRIVDGMKLVRGTKSGGSERWRLVVMGVSGVSAGAAAESVIDEPMEVL